ncbi:MAG: ArsR/SmtB family transcription factor [Nitrososphaeria archaeon]
MEKPDVLAKELDALGHPLRLKMIAMLRLHGEMHMALLASKLGVSRALVKIHMKKLEQAGLVRSRVVLVPGQAKALRMYELLDFKITVDPDIILKEVNPNE